MIMSFHAVGVCQSDSGMILLLAAAAAVLLPTGLPEAVKEEIPVFRGLPSITELATKAGFPISHIRVKTEDGHILLFHRLGNSSGPAVLIQHGIFNAADLWINRGPEHDLAYLLVKEGYDVYLGNQRGNVYCLNHVKFKRSDSRFWNFSFHESGYYDLPAMIDKILQMRDLDQIFYIGYSLGTTVFFVMGSLRPDYNRKVRAAVLLAPVAFPPPWSEFHITLIRATMFFDRTIWVALKSMNWVEIMPRTEFTIAALQDMCGPNSPLLYTCLDFIGDTIGENRANIDQDTVGYHLSFSPAGSSLKTVYHLSQIYKSNTFRMFDYGAKKNQELYGTQEPPDYKLEDITCPVALFWGRNDKLISEKSVKRIASHLTNLVIEKEVPDPLFTHFDVVLGKNAKEVLYDDVIKTINKMK